MVLQTILTRDHIRDLYREKVASQDKSKRDEGRRHLHQHHVVTYLSIMEHSQKFSRQITDTLDASVRHNDKWHPVDAADAFLALEKYALNLLDYPWKSEFKTLKLCGGFYQAQISPQLRQAMYIFMLMGYEKASDEILVMKQQSSSYDTLVYVACECFLAAVECLVMAQIWEKVEEEKFPIMDVYKSRMEVCGDIDQCVTWVIQHCAPQRRRHVTERTHSYNSFNSYHHNYGIISNSNSTGAKPKTNSHHNSNSVDHHVNSGILRSHKSKGNSSPTTSKRSRESRDSGYGSKSASKELPEVVPGRQRSEEIAPEDLYGHGKQVCDNNVAQLTMDMHELHLRDGRTGARLQTDSGTHDEIDDVHTAKTMDDHLRESQRYVKGIERSHSLGSPGHGSATLPNSKHTGPYDEWSDVRDKLRQDFGDKYFEGERGDMILKPQVGVLMSVRDPHQNQEKDKKKTDRKSFQNVDVVRTEVGGSSRHSKVEYGTADKYKGPMTVVAEKAKQAAEKSQALMSNSATQEEGATKPTFIRQNSAEDQRRFDNAAMVKDIVASSSVFKKLAADRSPSEESMDNKDIDMAKSMESLKSKDMSPTESVHSTVGELIDFSEAKVLHQMGCKFMPELRARPHGPVRLTPEEKLERKERKERKKKEKERKEKEREMRAEASGEEKSDAAIPVPECGGAKDATESKPLDKKPEPNVPSTSETTGNTKPATPCSATSNPSATKSYIAPPDNDSARNDQLSPIAECKENGQSCDHGKDANGQIIKKEILTNDVISNAPIVPPSNNNNNNAQPREPSPRTYCQQGGSPGHSAGMKGSCIAGHAALTNSTLSNHALGSHSPRCPVHGTPGVPHPLIAISHPHMPPGHIVMCSAGHAHIAPAHMAAMAQAQAQSQYVPSGPKEVPCPKPPPPPVAPKPSVKCIDNRRSLDIVASTGASRHPPAPPPRVSSALHSAPSEGSAQAMGGSLSDLPPPPPELLSDIQAPPPDLVSNHTPPSHSARASSQQAPPAPERGTKSLPATNNLPTEPPSYEAATGMIGRQNSSGAASYPAAMEEPDGLYVVADGPVARTQTWQCKACTYANAGNKKVCEMCGKSRIQGPEAAALLSGGSQCPRCTYVNSIGSLMCKVCMQDLQGSPTYI